jgi:hypothetical protein
MVQLIYEMPSNKRIGDQGKLCKGGGADMPHIASKGGYSSESY